MSNVYYGAEYTKGYTQCTHCHALRKNSELMETKDIEDRTTIRLVCRDYQWCERQRERAATA